MILPCVGLASRPDHTHRDRETEREDSYRESYRDSYKDRYRYIEKNTHSFIHSFILSGHSICVCYAMLFLIVDYVCFVLFCLCCFILI